MKNNIKIYAIMNIKNMTIKEYHLKFDDFGKVFCSYSHDIIAYNECKKYVNPFTHFIKMAHNYIINEQNEFVEILENKSYSDMENIFKNTF